MMRCFIWLIFLPFTACAPFYAATPLQPQRNIQEIASLTPNDAGFKQFAQKNSAHLTWPIQHWDLNTLTLSALYFHPALRIAAADYAVALAGIETAGLKPNVGLTTNLDKSNQANGDLKPWAYGLQVDIPVITANKRQINIEVAQHQAEIAKITMAETAWSLRYQLCADLVQRMALQAQLEGLTQLQASQSALLNAFEKRLALGVAGNTDVLQIRLQLDQVTAQLQQLTLQRSQNEQKIIHDAGLTDAQLQADQIDTPSLDDLLKVRLPEVKELPPPRWIQHQALTNRMDIQRGLSQYAKAEAQLKLQMAKRYPDLSLSPGLLYEYGDRIWALGIGGMLNLLNPASALWAQAEQVRTNEAKRFYSLQQLVIQQSAQRFLNYQQSVQLLATLLEGSNRQQQRLNQLEQQWRKGLVDKTEWLQAKIQYDMAQQRVVLQKVAVVQALLDIENQMQTPFLFNTQMPAYLVSTDSK